MSSKRFLIRIGPIIPLLLMVGLLLSGSAVARTDPATGRVRLLHMGCAFMRPDHPDPVFFRDPKIDLTIVPAYDLVMEYGDIQRMIRLYIPRSKQALDEKYDLVLIDGIDACNVRNEFLQWIVELIQEKNFSFVMSDAGSGWSFAGSGTSWYITPIEKILSVDDREGREISTSSLWQNAFRVVPVDPNHELMRNIPWEEVRFIAMNRPTERLGAKVIARMSDEKPLNRGKPVIAYFDYPNGGRSASYILIWQTMAHTPGIFAFYRWKWSYDMLVHMIYWPAKEPIPEDLTLVHRIRELISKLYYSRLYVISTIDFAEKAGANLHNVELDLAELNADRRRVDSLYNGNQMEECHDLCVSLQINYEKLIDKALKAKDKTFFWIFVVEWVVVSATSMVTAVIVWTLLVKRRLYREVGQTRLITDM